MPKIFVGESFTVALISGIEKVWIKGGGYQEFPSKIICLTVPKTLAGEPFRVSQHLPTRKVYELEGVGVSGFYVENFLSQCTEKFRRGTLWCFTIFGYRKSLDKSGESIKISRRKFFVSQCQKFP